MDIDEHGLGRLSQKGTKATKGQNGDGELAELVLGAPIEVALISWTEVSGD